MHVISKKTEHWSKFAALYRQWCRLHVSELFSSGTPPPQKKNSKKQKTKTKQK